MGVEFMQSNSLYNQLFQVGSVLHLGQHEARHSTWKHCAGAEDGGGGYFKQLLEGELESSISSSHYVSTAEEDSKPLIVRSLEINGNLGTPTSRLAQTLGKPDTPPAPAAAAAPPPPPPPPPPSCALIVAASHEDSDCLDSKRSFCMKSTSCINPPNTKRARESTQFEAMEGACKKEKKASEDKEIKGKKGGQQGAAMAARKVPCGKAKATKAVPREEAPKLDYVHVRARRGQATDSHSLAERVRREKISERMRFLQDLVPGCSKITGKAMVLDEIINYVQSLQNQVEFLAMRLAAIHPKPDHLSFHHFAHEEIASPYIEEEAKEHVDILSKTLPIATPTCDLHFESLPLLYSSFFEETNFTTPIVSDLSTSACNDSNTTNTMDFSHLS